MNTIYNYFNELSLKDSSIILIATLGTILALNTLKNWLELKAYFDRNKIPYDTPLPILGNFIDIIKKGSIEFDNDLIKRHGKIVGSFDASIPVILTTDLKFIKAVMIKDFSHFVNRASEKMIDAISYPFNKGVNNLRDEEWKNARTLVSPTFTSGKLKEMSKLMSEVSDDFVKSLEEIASGDRIFDAKKYFGCYTLDVMNICCFGIKINSLNDPNNEFIKHIKTVFSLNFKNPAILLLLFTPNLFRFLMKKKMINLLPPDSSNFLISYITQVIQLRKENKKQTRNDFIQHMIEVEDNSVSEKIEEKNENNDGQNKWVNLKRTVTNDEIIGHSFTFIAAGYETTAATLSFLVYNLAMHPECHEKLTQEIDEVLEKHNGEINYESVNEMHYLEMVINETLRMYPPAPRIERVANDDYEYNGIKFKKDMTWRVSVFNLHHDPDIYPEPYKFIPERFDEEQKKSRDSVAFMPFGAGPRNCIAMRFALIEMKLLLAKILSKYTFSKCDQTQNEMVLDKLSAFTKPLKDIVVKVDKR